MDHQQAKAYLLNKPFTEEMFPFGEEVAVYKVKNKMFATLAIGKMGKGEQEADNLDIWWVNLKCDPQEAIMLRDIFTAVIPGYHMNKVHWNTIKLDGTIADCEIEGMIDNSYLLVVNNMPNKDQQSILLNM